MRWTSEISTTALDTTAESCNKLKVMESADGNTVILLTAWEVGMHIEPCPLIRVLLFGTHILVSKNLGRAISSIPLLNWRVTSKVACPQRGCTFNVRVKGRLRLGRLLKVVIPVDEPSGGVPADKRKEEINIIGQYIMSAIKTCTE